MSAELGSVRRHVAQVSKPACASVRPSANLHQPPVIPAIPPNSTSRWFTPNFRKYLISLFFTPNESRLHFGSSDHPGGPLARIPWFPIPKTYKSCIASRDPISDPIVSQNFALYRHFEIICKLSSAPGDRRSRAILANSDSCPFV